MPVHPERITMSLPDLTADAVPVPAPRHRHEDASTRHPAERSPGGADQSVDPRVRQAREARRRADEMLRAAQKATRKAQLAREKADALGDRAALLEARLLTRLEQRTCASVPDRTRPCRGE